MVSACSSILTLRETELATLDIPSRVALLLLDVREAICRPRFVLPENTRVNKAKAKTAETDLCRRI